MGILKDYGALATIAVAAAGSLFWAGKLENNVSNIEEDVAGIERDLYGETGALKRLATLEGELDRLEKNNAFLQCKIAESNTVVWLRDYDLSLWAKPIDTIAKPNSRERQNLREFIRNWRSQLTDCQIGKEKLTKLVAMSEGFSAFHAGDFYEAYTQFGELDNSKSLTHRFMAAAAIKKAASNHSKLWMRRATNHGHAAVEMAKFEVKSQTKNEAIPVLECQALMVTVADDVAEPIKCYRRLIERNIKPAFMHAVIASLYAQVDQFEYSIEHLRKYNSIDKKEVDSRSLENDENLRKLLDTEFADEFRQILRNARVR